MRILRVIASLDPAGGGPVEGIRQITPVLSSLGHDTEIACLDPPNQKWNVSGANAIHYLGPSLTRYHYSNQWLSWIKSEIRRFDCVIIHGIWQYHSFGTWLALHNSSVPYFLYPHGMLDPWFKHTYPLKHLKKQLYWLFFEYHILKNASSVLFTCEQERLLAHQSFWPYHCHEEVVNYGTSSPPGESLSQRSIFLKSFPYLCDKRIILFLSRIHPKKGCDLLIQAFAHVSHYDPNLHIVMAGPDQVGWKKDLTALAQKLGVDSRISFVGMLEGDLKWGAFRCAEVFILPSHQENFGIAVVEALACGVPVLISDQVNIWHEIIQDSAGIAAPDTLEGTKNLLTQWIKLPLQKRNMMSSSANHCFRSHFEINRAAKSFIDVIKQSISE